MALWRISVFNGEVHAAYAAAQSVRTTIEGRRAPTAECIRAIGAQAVAFGLSCNPILASRKCELTVDGITKHVVSTLSYCHSIRSASGSIGAD